LSVLARRGSGSAARSVFGGYVEWRKGVKEDGSDSDAIQLLPPDAWPLAVVVAVTAEGPKATPSRDAMHHVSDTSPLFEGWLATQEEDLGAMRRAIAERDMGALGRIAEENCLRMHATCLSARPPVFYWTPPTIAAMAAVRSLRKRGTEAYFTIDAGPQVKVVCKPADGADVAEALMRTPGVLRVIRSGLGPGVEMIDGEAPWR
jgi:diphosphomevalonate decarboxylase